MSAQRPRSRQSRSVKVVVTGPYGAGKTTLVSTLSDISVLSTERKVRKGEAQRAGKETTTVAMDFGRLTVQSDLQLHLFGTPGQKRFDFMWEILADGMLGFVVLIDDDRPESYDEASQILDFFKNVASVPYVVAVNKVKGPEKKATMRARHALRLPDNVRVVATDCRDRDRVKDVVLELLYAVLDDVQLNQAAAV